MATNTTRIALRSTKLTTTRGGKVNGAFGLFPSRRAFSSASHGKPFPFLSLTHLPSTSTQVHSPTQADPAAAAYASQFLQAAKHHAFLAPRQSTRSVAAAVPFPTFPCEKSAIDRTFEAQTAGGQRDRAFSVNDVGVVERQYERWVTELPTVRPFYAVKCNPDTTLLRTLAGLGTGFDCASAEEIASCLAIGVAPKDIIFANPIKSVKDLKYAASVGVAKMTFDNEAELYKIKEHCPKAELVIRLLADDSGSKMKFGVKFGAPAVHVEGLLRTAKALNLAVLGTSFHIGSGCMDPQAYMKAIALSRSVFDMGARLGMPKFTFLDLGGGYPGNPIPNQRNGEFPAFEEMTAVIRDALQKHFPKEMGVQVIGEPGRYMATAWSTLFVLVQGKREEPKVDPQAKRRFLYYINDGVYGSFNCILFDHQTPEPVPAYRFLADKVSLDRKRVQANPYQSQAQQSSVSAATNAYLSMFSALEGASSSGSLMSARAFHSTNYGRDEACVGTFFGPTCDSMDVVATDYPCEELFVGDWLAFKQTGAYTNAAATTFNGMPLSQRYYCRSRQPSPDAHHK